MVGVISPQSWLSPALLLTPLSRLSLGPAGLVSPAPPPPPWWYSCWGGWAKLSRRVRSRAHLTQAVVLVVLSRMGPPQVRHLYPVLDRPLTDWKKSLYHFPHF